MISEELVVLRDDLDNESGQFGVEYKDVLFVFKSAEERSLWMDTTSTSDIEYIVDESRDV